MGENAASAIPFKGKLKSPIKGSAVLTDAQAADLVAGKDYVNVHTAANKDGEIRGQIEKAAAAHVVLSAERGGRPPLLLLQALSRIWVIVRVGVIASGSSLISMIAGLPLARARSKAGAKSAVFSTVSPWPP